MCVRTRALLADIQQALLDGVPLGFGERASFAQPVDGLQRGVDQLHVVLGAGKEGGAAGQQGQHGRADVPVQSQRGLGGAQRLLWGQEGRKLSPKADYNLQGGTYVVGLVCAYRIQRRRCPEVRQETDLQHMHQKVLVLDAVHPLQEEHHGSLVVGAETGRHIGLRHRAI